MDHAASAGGAPLTHDATQAPVVDTNQETLGVEKGSPSRKKRLSQVVNNLGRSLSGSAPSSPSGSSPRRLFSLKRKGKAGGDGGDDSLAPTPLGSRSASPQKPGFDLYTDDSPFISPPSPSFHRSFRGDGSMRMGTQTLIQALQAIPWAQDADDADESGHDTEESPESDDDELSTGRMASSIHTIYRPLARNKRKALGPEFRHPTAPLSPSEGDAIPESTEEQTDSDHESGGEDFEEDATPRIRQGPSSALGLQIDLAEPSSSPDTVTPTVPSLIPPALALRASSRGSLRAGSMNTVRRQRRSRLATKLRGIFELSDIDEVIAEMPCWLLRSVLLQGYMYLTNSYLCFFAHMPSREDQVLKSGNLSKKASRTKRWIRHWFILKNDALSWYHSSADPYFPHGIVDLRYTISCEAVGEKDFHLRTNQRSITLNADSGASRDEWVKAIRKVIFKGQNLGDSVKVAIPYSAILDVERSRAMDFSETIEIKVEDKEHRSSVDSYFFAYFSDLPAALEQIRDVVRSARHTYDSSQPQSVLDTTATRSQISKGPGSQEPQAPRSSTSAFRLGSLLRPFQHTSSSVTASPVPEEEFTHISKRTNSSSFVPVTTSPLGTPGSETAGPTAASSEDVTQKSQRGSDHTYPPSTSLDSSLSSDQRPIHRESSSSAWSVGVPSWLKSGRRILSGSGYSSGVKEVYSSTGSRPPSGSMFGSHDMAFSVLETPEMMIDPEVQDKFRAAFAYDDKETLLGYFPGYLFRLLPLPGKLYISTNHFCFKSSGPLTVRTKMALPIREILAVEKSKGSRLGHHGLIVIIRGHEELFFEFWAEDRRDALIQLLERQMEDVRGRSKTGDAASPAEQQETLILEDFDPREDPDLDDARPSDLQKSITDSLPAVMFTSASSTFLTFKPPTSLHFTFLTIGSRGDVQPYIALAKGLMADGHRVRIATHIEFKEWITSHNIEYGYVGGDPAELMRICVENGMFTVSFLRETLQKFRGWLDDLLKTSWEACQGTDVLVESPSAMGGYHIAEALRIPYFRAFTMTWSRTRAYPHAFAVPERKMGGSYNYMSYVMFDQVFWRAISGQVNRWRRNMLHIGSTSLDRMEPHKIPFLYNFSKHVVPAPLDWPEWIKVTGYWFLDDADVSAKKWEPPQELVAFLEKARSDKKPVVYIGFGSIVVSDPRAMTRCVIESVMRSGICAVLSKGWSDRLHTKSLEASQVEEPLPKEIYPISSVPHDWLFSQIDAACHHGGAGTTGASLRAGIPTIIHPFFGDQFFWADRVEALGVGSGVRKLTVDNLTEALTLATSDAKQIERARALGEQIRSENGVANAIEAIYRDLEYARSNIKRPRDEAMTDDEALDSADIRDADLPSRFILEPRSGYSSSGSAQAGGAPSEDWSVISDQDRSSSDENKSPERPKHHKRQSLSSAIKSALAPSSSHS